MAWFEDARFGMFIHWGHSSQQGIELSWPMVGGVFAIPGSQPVRVDDYHASAATFDPKQYEPATWARLAKRCHMQYAVFTTKHHDGYCMWDTKTTDFSIMRAPYGRDIVRQYVDAFRAEGVRPGFYFSLADWHHPDYPAFAQEDQPYRFPQGKAVDPERWHKFVDVMFAQIHELLTNYGEIAVIWFDGGWERTIEQWRAKDLEKMIRELQPGILINDRLPGSGDYVTPEQFVPPRPPARAWETCMTMNESWAYNPADTRYKSARQLVHTLCEVAGRGGNLLLNVGPRGDGSLPPEQSERLGAIAGWMEKHAESIIGAAAGLEAWQFYGPSTRRRDTVFLHLLMRPYETVVVRGVKVKRVRAVRVVGSGEELRFTTRTTIPDMLLNPDPDGELTISVPEDVLDPLATVLAIEFADAPITKP
jgi:alpha-L-fucosidase